MSRLSLFARSASFGTGHFVLHTFVGVIGYLFTVLLMEGLSGDLWYSPAIWLPCLLIGFFMNRKLHHRAAVLVWLGGLLWFMFTTGYISHTGFHWVSWTKYREQIQFPLRNSDCAGNECLNYVFGTLPLLNSVSYSIGAALGLLRKADRSEG